MSSEETSGEQASLPRKGIQSIETGMRLLDVLIETRQPMRLGELSKLSGLSPSKARMYLVSFIRTGLISQSDANGLYAPGPKSLRLGLVALGQNRLISSARELVHSFSKDAGVPVLLTAWGSNSPVIVESSEAGDTLPIAFRIGTRTPLWTTATGAVFLAYLPKETIEQAKVEACPKDVEEQAYQAAQWAREHGYSFADSVRITPTATLSGYGAVAAPILSAQGKLESVITALVPNTLNVESTAKLARQLVDKISHFSEGLI